MLKQYLAAGAGTTTLAPFCGKRCGRYSYALSTLTFAGRAQRPNPATNHSIENHGPTPQQARAVRTVMAGRRPSN